MVIMLHYQAAAQEVFFMVTEFVRLTRTSYLSVMFFQMNVAGNLFQGLQDKWQANKN